MLLLVLITISLILGPLGQVPLGNPEIHIYLPDIIASGLIVYWLSKFSELRKFIRADPIAKWFIVFASVALVSLVATPILLSPDQRLIAGLYLLRFVSYFFYYVTIRNLIKAKQIGPNQVLNTLIVSGVSLSVIGWLQYLIYPDLRNLFYLGWDPHLNRIFSTYFDPNFLGLMLVLTLIAMLVRSNSSTSEESLRATIRGGFSLVLILVASLVFVTLAFTYSRGSYLALVAAVLYWSFVKRNFTLLGALLGVLILAVVLLPRSGGHGVLLERTFSIEQRIENFRQGISLFTKYPLLGTGFNTLRYAKQTYRVYSDNPIEDHSGAGFDNSFLFVAVTTGVVGLIAYLLLLNYVFVNVGLVAKVSIVASIVHAMFVNSLFFPWVMLWLWVIVASDRVKESRSL